jgi:glycosyltransferase involved in cell wall biosynthesis
VKVAVLCRRLTGRPTDGFERYSNDLVAGMRSMGVEPLLPNQSAPAIVPSTGSLVSPPFYDIIYPTWQLLRGRMDADLFHAVTDAQAILFPWLTGRKVLTMHHVDRTPADSLPERAFRAFYGIGTKIGLRHADRIICVSSQTKKEVMDAYGVPDSRLEVVPHAISDKFRPIPGTVKESTVGFIGALKKRKNLEFLLRAFHVHVERYPISGLQLVLCGDGTDRASLEALAHELRIDGRVEFRGPVPEERLVETYNSFAMVAMTSHQEGFGLPILEAQACGVPVLTVDGALIPEEVARATVKCRDHGDMADRMFMLLIDREMRERIIGAGLEHASNFTMRRLAERTLAVYEKALND